MSRRANKRQITALLDGDDLQEILVQLHRFPTTELINTLFSLMCSVSDRIRWHAVWAFGRVVPEIATEDMERARVIMRRFLWSLNDESGGIGWGSPEAMAEIMARDKRLADEYLHMLISYMREDGPELFQDGNFLELPMIQRGVLWGVGRMVIADQQVMLSHGVEADIPKYLQSTDPVVRGLGVWCLCMLKSEAYSDMVVGLGGDDHEVMIFWHDRLQTFTVDTLVKIYFNREKAGEVLSENGSAQL